MGGCETAPVLAVLVCRDGERSLPDVLTALRESTVHPRRFVCVDLSSTDSTSELVAEVVDDVLTLPPATSFGSAVDTAVEYAKKHCVPLGSEEAQDEADPAEFFRWLWVLHDDSAPEPDCLEKLLTAGSLDEAAMLAPLGVNAGDTRFVSDAGLSIDSTGRRRSFVDSFSVDPALGGPGSLLVSEVLAASLACALIRWDSYERLGGLARPGDGPEQWELDADIDFGWRVNAAGMLVLVVPSARMRHGDPSRSPGGPEQPGPEWSRCPGAPLSTFDARRADTRTYLLNVTTAAFVLGVTSLCVLSLLRGLGLALQRRLPQARSEFVLLWQVSAGKLDLRRQRAERSADGSGRRVRGLLTNRITLVRNSVWGLFASVVRSRVRRELLLGRETGAMPTRVRSVPAVDVETRRRPRGGALARSGPVVVPVQATGSETATPTRPSAPSDEVASPRPRPSPGPATKTGADLLLVPVNARRVLRELLLSPPVVMAMGLVVLAVVMHGLLAELPRTVTGLAGGRLLPVADLGRVIGDYTAAWHPVAGGTATPAPPALLVLAVGGVLFAPLGGPATFLALLILAELPLAGVAAYVATRGVPVSRRARAMVATAYAVVPAAALSTSEGRVDVTVVHLLLPLVLAGLVAVLGLSVPAPVAASRHWLSVTCLTALGLFVVGAFAPLILVVLLLLTLLGYVVVPSASRTARRRLASLALVVVLPVACLLPWTIAIVQHPQFLLHGLGARLPGDEGAGLGLLFLNPNGSVAGWAGGVLVVGAVAALATTARNTPRIVIPAMIVALAGWAVAVLVESMAMVPIGGGPAVNGWSGGPLLLVAAGLLWAVLVCRRPAWVRMPVLVGAVLVLAAGAVLGGRAGPLQAAPSGEGVDGTVLVVEAGPAPARLASGRAHFGDADRVPSATAAKWLRRIDDELLSGDPERVRYALAGASVRGVDYVSVPPGTALAVSAPDLVTPHGQLDGAELARLNHPSGGMSLLGPDLSRQARDGVEPSPRARPVPVEGAPPNVVVRVSEGGAGRTLVLAAANEPGWRAEIDGRPVPLATAWNGLVGVPLPERASKVEVFFTDELRPVLLVTQAVAILVTLIGSIPEARRRRW